MQKDESLANEKKEEGRRKRPLPLMAGGSKKLKTEEEEDVYHLDVSLKGLCTVIFVLLMSRFFNSRCSSKTRKHTIVYWKACTVQYSDE